VQRLIDAGVPVAQFKVEELPPRFLDQLRHVRGYLEPRILALQNRTGVGIATQNDIDAEHEIAAQEIDRQQGPDDAPVLERGIHGESAVPRDRRRGRPPGNKVDVEKVQALRHKCSLTQELLAEKADLGYHEVVRIENSGRASLEQLTAMAEVFAALGESVTAESLKLQA